MEFGINKHKEIFKTNKSALAHRASALCSLWKISTFLSYIKQNFHTLSTGTSFSFNIFFNSEWFVPFVNKHTSTLSECSECAKHLKMEKRKQLSTDLGEVREIQPQQCISSAVILESQLAIWFVEHSGMSGKFWNTFMKALNETDDCRSAWHSGN